MDFRVYVDGIPRIICDLNDQTTIHDIIIALAQYKNQPGRYSLFERRSDGQERTLSPNLLACEFQQDFDSVYILRQNSSPQQAKRSKSVDDRPSNGTATTSTIVEILPSSSSGHLRTVSSVEKKKHTSIQPNLSSVNTNNNNNNHLFSSESIEQKRPSRLTIPIIEPDFDPSDPRRTRTIKSLLPLSNGETSAFQLVHPSSHLIHTKHVQEEQQQQYITLLKMLKSQEIEVEQQKKELHAQQKEIDHRERILKEYELHQKELLYQKQLKKNYDHFQQQFKRCSKLLENKRLVQEEIQVNIRQIHQEIDDLQTKNNHQKQDIHQCQHDLECSTSTFNQQEELVFMLNERNDDIERMIEQRRQQITDLENELIHLDDLLISTLIHPCYHFPPPPPASAPSAHYTSCPSAPILAIGRSLPTMNNNTLWKLSPSGIWV